MQEPIGIVTVLSNTLTHMGWTGFTFACAIAFIGILWMLVPFAVYGLRTRVEGIEYAVNQSTELSLAEMKRTNDLLLMIMSREGDRGMARPIAPTAAISEEEPSAPAMAEPESETYSPEAAQALLADVAATRSAGGSRRAA